MNICCYDKVGIGFNMRGLILCMYFYKKFFSMFCIVLIS